MVRELLDEIMYGDMGATVVGRVVDHPPVVDHPIFSTPKHRLNLIKISQIGNHTS